MTLFWVTTNVPALVGQSELDDWSNLLYLLLVLVLPMLSALGSWIRKRYGNEPGEPADRFEDISEDEVILLPEEPVQRPVVPQARPAAPVRPVVVIAPAAPPVRPVAEPVSPWEPPPRQPLFTPPPVAARGYEAPRPTRRVQAEARREVAKPRVASEPMMSKARADLGVLTREELRRAILLREVLGPPAALRPPGEASWER